MRTEEGAGAAQVPIGGQAFVPWAKLKFDVALVAFGIAAVVVSWFIDLGRSQPDYFPRSGALMVLCSAYLAYRGLAKYWVKAENSFARGYWLRGSRNQQMIDLLTLALSLIGTVIWGYGDKLFLLFVGHAA